MDVIALISGGKDSCYNMMQCVAEGHRIVALANLRPNNKDELDSYMYQTVGHHAIDLYAEAMDLPLYRRTITGGSVEQGKEYFENPEDEVEDLYYLLKEIKESTNATAVSVGAILSDYQRVRVEHVCVRLGLIPLAYLWRRDQKELLKEMIDCQIRAILIKVAAMGLEPEKHLGKTLEEIYPHMEKMESQYGLNMCGEGGEYETFTLDCPLFKKKIVIEELTQVMHSDDAFAPVAYLNLKSMSLESKSVNVSVSQAEMIKDLPMKRGCQLLSELELTEEEIVPETQTEMCSNCNQQRLAGTFPVISAFKANSTLYLSGIYGHHTDDVPSATATALNQLKGKLEEHGFSLTDLVAVYLYVCDMSLFSEINATYKTFFTCNPPIRVCVEASLPPDVLIQMDCVASLSDKTTMHVQGLSHWAPANIGPYSQAVQVASTIYVAGQIAMQPANLSIILGGPAVEARLSLRHCDRVLLAMHSSFSNIVIAICYVTHREALSAARAEWDRHNTQHQGLLAFVIVQGLPKAATVEWQVRTAPTENCIVRRGINKENNLTAHWQSIVCDDSISALLLSITCSAASGVKEAALVHLLATAVKDAQQNATCNTRTLRVFFRAGSLQQLQLLKGYEAVAETLPVIHFVPVLGFPDSNCLITACF